MLNQLVEEIKKEITKEMVEFFYKRTEAHIERVRKNIRKIIAKFPELDKQEMENRAFEHDDTKYGDKEFVPYVLMTWNYKQVNHPTKGLSKEAIGEIDNAVESHYKANDHHTDHYSDVKKMSKEAIAEMVSDWASMSQEKGNSLKKWADSFVAKHAFSDEQKEFINRLVDLLG
ncbi:MAG: hypothetical protein HQK96_20640 [Nitrospirae bacterium]|nr:hypothetical protein [Nitrospirota bacterium]